MSDSRPDDPCSSRPAEPPGHARRRPRVLALSGAALAVALPVGLFGYAAGWGRTEGRLVPEPRVVDLGSVAEAVEISTSFRLTNPSSVPIDVVNAVTSCGCTTTGWLAGIVPAGSSVEVPLTIRAPTHKDRINSSITFRYRHADDDREVPRSTTVTITGLIDRDYRVDKPTVSFGRVDGAARVTRSLHLSGVMKPDIQVLGITCRHEAYSATAELISHDPNRWRIDVQLKAFKERPDGLSLTEMLIQTNSDRKPQAHVSLSTHIQSVNDVQGALP